MKKEDYATVGITCGLMFAIIGFIAGIIITAVGGGWETMQRSELLMNLWRVDWCVLMGSIGIIIANTIWYVALESKGETKSSNENDDIFGGN